MHALATVPGVRSSVLVGDSIHVFVQDGEERPAQVRAELERRDIQVDAIEPMTPSIEDLFVSAVERGATAGAGAAEKPA